MPVAQVAADRARAVAVVVLEQIQGEPLLVAVELLVVLEQLLVEHVQDGLAGDVGHVVSASRGRAAERPRSQVAGVVAVEGDARVLEPEDLLRRLAAHDLDRVLVAQEVGALHGVERVRLPRVLGVECRVYPAGGGHRVRADRMDLRHDSDRGAGLGGRQRRSLAREAGADDQNVVGRHGGAIVLIASFLTFTAPRRPQPGRAWLGRAGGQPQVPPVEPVSMSKPEDGVEFGRSDTYSLLRRPKRVSRSWFGLLSTLRASSRRMVARPRPRKYRL